MKNKSFWERKTEEEKKNKERCREGRN